MSEEVRMYGIRKECNFCHCVATYDGRTVFGPWAYMCDEHFAHYGVGLGTGKGQKLIYSDEY